MQCCGSEQLAQQGLERYAMGLGLCGARPRRRVGQREQAMLQVIGIDAVFRSGRRVGEAQPGIGVRRRLCLGALN